MEISLDKVKTRSDPYQLFLDSIRSPATLRRYKNHLHTFLKLIPNQLYTDTLYKTPKDRDVVGAEYLYSTVPGSDKIEDMIGVGQEITITNPPDVKQPVTLKQQLTDNIPLEKILCSSSLHVLTERTNGNLACVFASTAEKLGWKLINQDMAS